MFWPQLIKMGQDCRKGFPFVPSSARSTLCTNPIGIVFSNNIFYDVLFFYNCFIPEGELSLYYGFIRTNSTTSYMYIMYTVQYSSRQIGGG